MNWRQLRAFLLDNLLRQGTVLSDASAIFTFLMRLSCPRDLMPYQCYRILGHGKCCLVLALGAFLVPPFPSNVRITINTKIEFSLLIEVQCLLVARVQEFFLRIP